MRNELRSRTKRPFFFFFFQIKIKMTFLCFFLNSLLVMTLFPCDNPKGLVDEPVNVIGLLACVGSSDYNSALDELSLVE